MREDTIKVGVVIVSEIRQKLYSAQKLWDIMPEEFIEKYHVRSEHFIGLEWILPNEYLGLHTDIGGRRSNILINIGDYPATIQHSNNDVPEDRVILPGDFFVLDTCKMHGCDNRKNNNVAEFITVNNRINYKKCLAQF